jgi:plastocyanin
MNKNTTLAAGLVAIFAAAMALPAQNAFAATVNAEMVPGAQTKSDDAYSPNPIEISVGDTVIWTNKDSAIHTVSAGTPSAPDMDGFGWKEDGTPILIAPNKTFEFTFDEAGEFPYYCTLHPAMVGLVKVAGGAPSMMESEAEAELDGETYTVTAKSADVEVIFLDIAPNEYVEVEFDGPGEVELTLPTTMIQGVSAVSSLDEEEIEFTTVSSTASATTIRFTVPEDGVVDITGATVVPEFGVIAALVLAASLAAMIGFARFRPGFLGRF